tara:strand:- start:583 stop:2511 length:1929 start_codon:yes stop_codon:yes gene_type:complete
MESNVVILSVILLFAMFSFIFEWMRIEVTALAISGIILLVDVIAVQAFYYPEGFLLKEHNDIFAGFSNSAVIAIGAMFVLSRSLVRTGFLVFFADFMYKWAGRWKWFSIFLLLLIVSLLSGLINNTAVVAIFIPLVIDICQRYHISPSKLLLPLSYAAIFGGTLTLIGTSTNLLVNSIVQSTAGYEQYSFSMFEFTKLGLIFLGVGTIYNIIAAKWLIPSRSITGSLTQKYHISKYITEYRVPNKSNIIGKNFNDFKGDLDYSFDLVRIIRQKKDIVTQNIHSVKILEDDVIIIRINADNILKFKSYFNLLILPDVKMSQQELEGENHVIVEAIITQQSSLIGKTISGTNFRNIFSSFVLAVRRQQSLLREKVSKIKLKFSDTLLIMVPKDKVEKLKDSIHFIVLEELNIHLNYHRYWWASILVIPCIMLLSSFNVVPIHIAAILGCVVLLALRTITVEDAFESINLSVIFLIAALIPLGIAIEFTGLDRQFANLFLAIESVLPNTEYSNYIFLAIFYFVTFFFTAFLSNAVIAIILTPISFLIAEGVGCNPKPFLMAICFGASACFMTPMGYQTNMMVFGPGQYKMKDFVYLGLPLNLIFWGLAIYMIPIFWPFDLELDDSNPIDISVENQIIDESERFNL